MASQLPLALTFAVIVQLGIVHQAAAAPLPGTVSGAANSLRLFLGASTVASPTLHSAAVDCPCTGTKGVTRTATVSAVSLGSAGSLLSASTGTATALATNTANAALSTESAQVSKLSLLGGLITADAITAKATMAATPSALTPSSDGTAFTNLVIAGTSIDPAVPENTAIPLPGLGSVTVKAVQKFGAAKKAVIVVDGLVIAIDAANSFGLPVGSHIVVATAKAGYDRVQPAAYQAASGVGAAVSGQVGTLLNDAVGLGHGVGMPSCAGTGGTTLSSSAVALNIPGVASAAAEQASVFGGTVDTALVTKTTATVSNLSLLGGLIKADTLSSVAQVSRTGNISTASAAGSGLTGLTVAGVPISPNATPNQKLTLPGIGYVIVNEQTTSGSPEGRIEVIGLDVNVTQSNLANLPVGLRLVLGRAVAVARRF